ncbi:MAG: hypothetical protein WCV91_05670 [Candidatus Margulisiibacteriota bacterium]
MFTPGTERVKLNVPHRPWGNNGNFPTKRDIPFLKANGARATVIVIDSAGMEVMPVHPPQDVNAGTIPNTAAYYDAHHPGKFKLPNMEALGLGNIAMLFRRIIAGVPRALNSAGAFGALALSSDMTDTPTGHWDAMGLRTGKYPTYPNGIPKAMMEEIEGAVSRELREEFHFTQDGKNISGTTILEQRGAESRDGHQPIIYTSTDSVFQIAWHIGRELKEGEVVLVDENTKIITEEEKDSKTGLIKIRTLAVNKKELEKMYRVCGIVREYLNNSPDEGLHFLRVIARPFADRAAIGKNGERFVRSTSLRRDYVIPPPGKTILDYAMAAGYFTGAVGKVFDLFSGRGIFRSWPDPSEHRHLKGDMEGIDFVLEALGQDKPGIILANLLQCDEDYGHRNNPEGYAENLMAIDARLPEIFRAMRPWDIVIIIADHGNDPTRGLANLLYERGEISEAEYKLRGTNHTREIVPLLIFGDPVLIGANLGIHQMSDLGAFIAHFLGFRTSPNGTSFLDQVLDRRIVLG